METYEDDVLWLLEKIKSFTPGANRKATWSWIFLGSYDVWSEAYKPYYLDVIKRYNLTIDENIKDFWRKVPYMIIDARFRDAKKNGWIINESGEDNFKHGEVWKLTEAGEQYLLERGRK